MRLELVERAKSFVAFSFLFLALLVVTMRGTPLASLFMISLKLSALVHLPGYLIALKVLREEYDQTALLFIGFGLGLVMLSLLAYFVGTVGLSVTKYTYAMPLGLLAFSALLHAKKPKAGG